MSRPEKSTKPFVIDTNVFVAAIKPFTKKETSAKKEIPSAFTLLTRLLADDGIQLIANAILVGEYRRLEKELNSPTSTLLLELLIKKMEITEVKEEAIHCCKPYISKEEAADTIHAATCLQTGAILITNDGDFDKIKDERIINVWSISDAIRQILFSKQ